MPKENNTKTTVKLVEKDGRKFYNFYNETTLNDGSKVTYQVKLAFPNKKFAYKLYKGLESNEKR